VKPEIPFRVKICGHINWSRGVRVNALVLIHRHNFQKGPVETLVCWRFLWGIKGSIRLKGEI
jgi:hypothetical protein